jgi:DNA-binding CsgD family transcriptional regulator
MLDCDLPTSTDAHLLPSLDTTSAIRVVHDAPPTPLLQHLETVLDRLTDGTVVIDAAGRVLHANRRAREVLALARDVAVPSGRLSFRNSRTQRAFEQTLAIPSDEDASGPRSRGFLVRDGAGVTIARAWVEPLQRRARGDDSPSRFLVSLHQLPQHTRVSTDTLQALYGLTPSEARVAAHVVAAGSVDELSSQLDLSRNTVKSHLRRTFRKCEVRSLAQLTALIATGPRMR